MLRYFVGCSACRLFGGTMWYDLPLFVVVRDTVKLSQLGGCVA